MAKSPKSVRSLPPPTFVVLLLTPLLARISLMYRVHMVHSMHDADLYRLNTDVWLEYL